MRFDSDSDGAEDRKRFLEERIAALEGEVRSLKKELADSIRAEARWEKENEGLKRKSLAIGNRRAKRDSLVNAAEKFEKDIAEVVRHMDIEAANGVWVRGVTEDEIAAEVRQQLLEMMATARCLYPNIGLERIFRK